jgi:hypothetical protein
MRGEEESQKTHLDAVVYSPPMREKYTCSPHAAAPGALLAYVVLAFHRKVKAILTASRAGIATTCCPWVAQGEALAEQEEGDFFSVKPTFP